MKFLSACRLSLALAALPALVLARPSAAQNVFVAGNNSQFGTMDITNGHFLSRGTLALSGSASFMAGMVFAPDGTLYGLDNNAELYRVNTANGGLSDLGSLGTDGALAATFGDGQMYFLDNPQSSSSGTNSLFAVDLTTRKVTQIGDTGQQGDGVLAFDKSGRLLMGGQTGDNGFLYSVDTATGDTTEIGDTGSPKMTAGVNVNGVVYAFGYAFGDNNLIKSVFTLNTATGAGTVVSSYKLANPSPGVVEAAAFLPPPASVPEPGLLLAFGLASSAGVFGLRRGRRRV